MSNHCIHSLLSLLLSIPASLLTAPLPTSGALQLPSTCTYSDYVSTVPKACRLAFGGNAAFALLQSSTSLSVDVHRCSGASPDALPSLGIALGGDATVRDAAVAPSRVVCHPTLLPLHTTPLLPLPRT